MPQNLLKNVSIYPVLPVPGPSYDSLAKNDDDDDDQYAVTDVYSHMLSAQKIGFAPTI
jgi:hypothetical protein